MFPIRTKNALLDFRSAGVSPAGKKAGGTPALRFACRAIPWLAVLALAFAWSGQAFAKEKASPNKPKKSSDVTISTAVTVDQPKTDRSGNKGATTVNVTVVGGGMGQFPATLDQALASALQTSPKVMVAKAKVTIAEAELSAAQMEVARRIVQSWTDRQLRQAEYDRWLERNKRAPGSVPTTTVIESGAAVAQLEMELRSLIGQASSTVPLVGRSNTSVNVGSNRSLAFERPAKPLQLPHGPIVEKIRKALMSQTEMLFTESPLQEVMDYLRERHKIDIQLDARALDDAGTGTDTPITINLKGITLADALQAWDDKMPDLKFVVRNYGILVTTPERAREQGYFPVVDFARLTAGGNAAMQTVVRQIIGPDGRPETLTEMRPIPDDSAEPTLEPTPGPLHWQPMLDAPEVREVPRTHAPQGPQPQPERILPIKPATPPPQKADSPF
jgi:hypothetical protein